MWNAAIQAVKSSDDHWIKENRSRFHLFFETANESPTGKLRETALEHHYEARLFKALLGREYNGLGLSLATGSQWIERCATLNPNWGWLIAIATGGAYFADYMPHAISKMYFSPREALVAGSGKPDGAAVRQEDGRWSIQGSWNYCSGSEQASVFTAVTTKGEKILAFILPKEQARIQRDWNVIGLPLTCSHTITTENASIPEDHFFDLSAPPRVSEYPLATYPFQLFALICFVPVVLGITIAFWMEAESLLKLKQAQWKEFQPHRYDYLENRLKEHSVIIADLKSKFYLLVEESWSANLEGRNLLEKEVSESGLFLAKYCYTTTAAIIPKLGMGVLAMEHPIQRLWQDLQTAYQHTVFHW